MKKIVVLGSTGSVGKQTLAVIQRFPEEFQVAGLVAGTNMKELATQIRTFGPATVSVANAQARQDLKERLKETGSPQPEIGIETTGACQVAGTPADLVMSAMVGAAGLAPTWTAIEQGTQIALANKEILVMAGELVTAHAKEKGVTLLPVDSEHVALHQVLANQKMESVKKLLLTASGGPFLNTPPQELERVTPTVALKHPRWEMGPKITIDSATLVNKAFELFEARWLFDVPLEQIEIVVHPESIVHGLVEFMDGSMTAQLADTDMAGPIAYALAWPHRLKNVIKPLNLAAIGSLTFREPNLKQFPALEVALDAFKAGGTAPCVLAAADEVAVNSFLQGAIPFTRVPEILASTLDQVQSVNAISLDVIVEADRMAREAAREVIRAMAA